MQGDGIVITACRAGREVGGEHYAHLRELDDIAALAERVRAIIAKEVPSLPISKCNELVGLIFVAEQHCSCCSAVAPHGVARFLTPFVVLGPRPGIQARRGSRGPLTPPSTNGPRL